MRFRYDFGEVLDLTRFQKQASHYIGAMREVSFQLYVRDFRIIAEIASVDEKTSHTVKVYLEEISRDSDNEIETVNLIYPFTDIRFKEIKIINEIFTTNSSIFYESFSVQSTIDNISFLIKLLHKINNLKVFL